MKIFSKLQALVLLAALPCVVSAKVIDAGVLSREDNIKAIPVEVISSSNEVGHLARNAFSVHGSYDLVSNGGDYIFRLDQVSPQSIKLTIEAGNSKVAKYSETIQGRNLTDAALKACDIAVEKTLGSSGFFSGKITFVGERSPGSTARELFSSDLFFKNVTQLTRDAANAVSPRWSPEGNRIIYTSYYKTGFPDIFIIDLVTGERKTVAGYSGTNCGGSFSPNGNKIAMILSSSGNSELYTADVSGRSPKRLTKTKGLEASPVWAPDGKSIYYTSDDLGAPQIYSFNLQSGQAERIPTNISKYCAEPALNPENPNIISFTAATNGTFQIALYDKKTKESKFLTNGPVDYIESCWLSDGRHLLATRRNGEKQELVLIDSLSRKISRLHSDQFGYSSMPSFYYGK